MSWFTNLKRSVAPSAPSAGRKRVWYNSGTQRYEMVDGDSGVSGLSLGPGWRDNNLIINGEFDYAQRQAPGTLTTYSQTASRGYSADRWAITNENTSVQYQQTDTSGTPQAGLLSRYFGTFSKITTTGKIEVSQAVEAGNCLHLRGRTVRVQFKLKASSAKVIRAVLLQLTNAGTVDTVPGYAAGAPSGNFITAHGANTVDPTFGTNLSKIAPVLLDNTTSRNTGLDCAATTSWQRFGATFALPTDFKNLVLVIFTDSQFAAADSFSISEVGIYDGEEVRDWAPRTNASDLLNCLRYYCKSFPLATAPAQNAGLAGSVRGWVSVAGAVSTVNAAVRFPVCMRIAPALTFFNPSAANAFMRNTTAATDATATSGTNSSECAVEITSTGAAGWTVAQSTATHFAADAEL